MSKTDYQFSDFLGLLGQVADDCVGFVLGVHEKLRQMGCKVKISSTKAYPYQLAYTMPNSRKGILNFYLRKKGLKVRITIVDPEQHAPVLNRLPEHMISQIDKKNVCRKLVEGCECLDACTGFDFHIGESHYQKCRFYCFQFDVDAESMPILLELLEREIAARLLPQSGFA
ncbi:MAG: hypothetical protein FWD99_00805 [Oscillospiraceae bacterium]|nr:hypothetical protein [Oscillospiraceae bacterium]